MLPESYAPALEHYDEFKTFMQERGVRCMRHYVPLVEVDGEMLGDFWTIQISKEQELADGRLAAYVLDMGEKFLDGEPWHAAWEMQIELLELGLADVVAKEG